MAPNTRFLTVPDSNRPGRHNGFCRLTIKSRTSSISLIPNPPLPTSAALRASEPLRLGARSPRLALRPNSSLRKIALFGPPFAQVDDARQRHHHHQSQLRRVGNRVRRPEDDDRATRSSHPPLSYPRNRKRQLPLQKQLCKAHQTRKGETSKLDEPLTSKPSSSRVTSQWKSRVKSQRKSTPRLPKDPQGPPRGLLRPSSSAIVTSVTDGHSRRAVSSV